MDSWATTTSFPVVVVFVYLFWGGGLPLHPAPGDLAGAETLDVAGRDGLHAHGAHHPLLYQLQQFRPARIKYFFLTPSSNNRINKLGENSL